MNVYIIVIGCLLVACCDTVKTKSSQSEILEVIIDAIKTEDLSKVHDFVVGEGRKDTKNVDRILALAYGSTLDFHEFLGISEALYKWPDMVSWGNGVDSDDKVLHLRWHKISEFGTKMEIDQFFIIGIENGRYNIKIPH